MVEEIKEINGVKPAENVSVVKLSFNDQFSAVVYKLFLNSLNASQGFYEFRQELFTSQFSKTFDSKNMTIRHGALALLKASVCLTTLVACANTANTVSTVTEAISGAIDKCLMDPKKVLWDAERNNMNSLANSRMNTDANSIHEIKAALKRTHEMYLNATMTA